MAKALARLDSSEQARALLGVVRDLCAQYLRVARKAAFFGLTRLDEPLGIEEGLILEAALTEGTAELRRVMALAYADVWRAAGKGHA